tara:strand:+ start:305294 stop:305653 length:360 start_codon:yes stop_codon:yes gene_type:complete
MSNKVLIVDDEEEICRSMQLLLSAFDIEADYAFNHDEAIKQLSANSYKLVLSDIKMPGKDGIELVKSIRKQFGDQKVILMSGFSEYTLEEVKEMGVLDLYSKPLDMDSVLSNIQSILSH